MNKEVKLLDIVKRAAAFMIDSYIISFIILAFVLACGVIISVYEVKQGAFLIDHFELLIIGFMLFLIIVRDIPFGRSIGKRLLKMEIVRVDESRKPNIFMLFLRNVTIFIYPIEIIFYLFVFKGEKKIGDLISKTRIKYN